MADSPRQLKEAIDSLKNAFPDIGSRLVQAAEELRQTGKPVPPDLMTGVDRYRQSFSDLSSRARDCARSLTADSSLAEVEKAIDDLIRVEDAVDVLLQVERLVPGRGVNLPELEPCVTRARNLHARLLEAGWSGIPEIETSVAGFRDLMRLIEKWHELEARDWLALLEATSAAFGEELAAAAARGRLEISTSPAASEQSDEPERAAAEPGSAAEEAWAVEAAAAARGVQPAAPEPPAEADPQPATPPDKEDPEATLVAPAPKHSFRKHLEVGEALFIRSRDGSRKLKVLVAGVGADKIELESLNPAMKHEFRQAETVELEYGNDKGLHRCDAVIDTILEDHHVVVTLTGKELRLERRKFARLQLQVPFYYVVSGSSGSASQGEVMKERSLNICAGGVSFRTGRALGQGDDLRVSVPLSTSETVDAAATVVRSEESHGEAGPLFTVAARFTDLDPEMQDYLQSSLASRVPPKNAGPAPGPA